MVTPVTPRKQSSRSSLLLPSSSSSSRLAEVSRLLVARAQRLNFGLQILMGKLIKESSEGDEDALWDLLEHLDRLQAISADDYSRYRALLVRLEMKPVTGKDTE